MIIGITKEIRAHETRVALAPETVKKLQKKKFRFYIEKGCGLDSGFPDSSYEGEGVELTDSATALSADVVLKLHKPTPNEIAKMRKGSVLISFLEPYLNDGTIENLAQAGIEAMAMELIPRISRAQSMDALSSQAGIAGYRAVLEAACHYNRFFPLMMTAAGSSRPAKLMVLGAGVAGLQAIATAKRLGAAVEAYDVRPETKEQIASLGGKPVELDVGESGSGVGGYAKELSEEAKKRQQQLLSERLKKQDLIISTANIPGRKAPVLILEDTVKGMKPGSVIVDMAAANGGNCPLTEADRVVVKNGVTLIGYTNFPGMVPADASFFYGNNLFHLVNLLFPENTERPDLSSKLEDEIVAGALVTYRGEVRTKNSSEKSQKGASSATAGSSVRRTP